MWVWKQTTRINRVCSVNGASRIILQLFSIQKIRDLSTRLGFCAVKFKNQRKCSVYFTKKMANLNQELNRWLAKIGDETINSLGNIQEILQTAGKSVDDTFKINFLKSGNYRYLNVFTSICVQCFNCVECFIILLNFSLLSIFNFCCSFKCDFMWTYKLRVFFSLVWCKVTNNLKWPAALAQHIKLAIRTRMSKWTRQSPMEMTSQVIPMILVWMDTFKQRHGKLFLGKYFLFS